MTDTDKIEYIDTDFGKIGNYNLLTEGEKKLFNDMATYIRDIEYILVFNRTSRVTYNAPATEDEIKQGKGYLSEFKIIEEDGKKKLHATFSTTTKEWGKPREARTAISGLRSSLENAGIEGSRIQGTGAPSLRVLLENCEKKNIAALITTLNRDVLLDDTKQNILGTGGILGASLQQLLEITKKKIGIFKDIETSGENAATFDKLLKRVKRKYPDKLKDFTALRIPLCHQTYERPTLSATFEINAEVAETLKNEAQSAFKKGGIHSLERYAQENHSYLRAGTDYIRPERIEKREQFNFNSVVTKTLSFMQEFSQKNEKMKGLKFSSNHAKEAINIILWINKLPDKFRKTYYYEAVEMLTKKGCTEFMRSKSMAGEKKVTIGELKAVGAMIQGIENLFEKEYIKGIKKGDGIYTFMDRYMAEMTDITISRR